MPLQNQPILEQALEFEDWGLVDYQQALERQLSTLERIHETDSAGVIVFCTHPPVVTLGRSSQDSDISGWQGQRIEVSRGGRATYHGPSQLMVYPIVNLKRARKNRKEKEVVGFLRDFENAIVETLAEYDLPAQGKSLQKKGDGQEDATGVWVGSHKIASLGLAVKKWITYHGAAINLDDDPEAFKGLLPCGFQPQVMTNLEARLGRPVQRQEFKAKLLAWLQRHL
jgi:lipoyl(octanoyl) transferase